SASSPAGAPARAPSPRPPASLLPNESEITHSDTRFLLNAPEVHTTNIAVFGGLEFPHPGLYPVEILLDADLVLRFPLHVVQIHPQNAPSN
ncbi:MAG: hypothetical protein HC901_03100, partial [Bdellovibrionaceae bacterium]|nr:hypothetical protein [Pseudobdellovibrionaceae bacterium]